VTCFRPYRNGDSPALADLWNRATPERGVVRPLTVHEFDALAIGKLHFDAAGLIVAQRDGQIVGFAHAGFGPAEPLGPSHELDQSMGTVSMVMIDPRVNDPALEQGLLVEAERYLRSRGASVVYAGGQSPLNPFYWGIYGGSEFSGILDSHTAFRRVVDRAGYEPAASTVLFEIDLTRGEPRDPRAPLFRRQCRVEVIEDVLPAGWWQALAIGLFRPSAFQLVEKSTSRALARATTWDIASGYGIGDGRTRTGLIDVEVELGQRRRGYGRHLVSEILRYVRGRSTDVVVVQTSSMNHPALGLYRSIGFEAIETATLYRLPAQTGERPRDWELIEVDADQPETL
jgi:GNAT superfamily N-acetyltransferase